MRENKGKPCPKCGKFEGFYTHITTNQYYSNSGEGDGYFTDMGSETVTMWCCNCGAKFNKIKFFEKIADSEA